MTLANDNSNHLECNKSCDIKPIQVTKSVLGFTSTKVP